MAGAGKPDVGVAIVGSGFAGLGMGIRLQQSGRHDFVILERAEDIGGTWRDNSYPGCACDVPSDLYSFSFAPNPRWSRAYSPQPEILAYLHGLVGRFALSPHLRLGHAVTDARWDEGARVWRIETSRGPLTARVMVVGCGALSEPSIPTLKGLESFEGRVFHSARWDHGYDLAGKRVGVVGTGASAIQFVPAIQPLVGHLDIFQRTPPWILPRVDWAVPAWEQALYALAPPVQALVRGLIFAYRELYVFGFRSPAVMAVAQQLAERHLEAAVPDPGLRAKLRPDYALGCKRILRSNDYYPALQQPNVALVSAGIREVVPDGLVTQDGRHHALEALIFGTGFTPTDPPYARMVRGREGRTLAEVWAGSPQAYAGTTVAGFPNMFLLFGPNTGLGHTSVLLMLEAQIAHVLAAVRGLEALGAAAIEPRPEAQAAYVAKIDRMMEGTVWTAGGCASWYLDRTGRNSTLWPGFTSGFVHEVERFDSGAYRWEMA